MEIVVTARHTEIPDRFRRHVQDKIAKIERLDHKVFRVAAELSREHNPRLSGQCDRVELTVYSRGPVIRAEAAARDPYAALDLATSKLAERLRRAADRRVRRHCVTHDAPPPPAAGLPDPFAVPVTGEADPAGGDLAADDGPFVVREKKHHAEPMTLDDALYEMELVGHDFYLFHDREAGLPAVVYRRRGYAYGVLHLETGGSPMTQGDVPARQHAAAEGRATIQG